MAIRYNPVPLYSDPDYEYTISFDRVAYKLRFYYNQRMEKWIINVHYANDTPIVVGEALVASYPIFLDYSFEDLNGFFWLEPIGPNQNETIQNPYEIYKYYRLFYYWDDGTEEE